MRPAKTSTMTVALLVALCAGCGDDPPTDAQEPPELSVEAETYLDSVLTIMELHSVNRYKIDWPSFRQNAFANAAGAQTPSDTHAAIGLAVTALGDNHSFFLPPGVAFTYSDSVIDLLPDTLPKGGRIENRFGYLLVPRFFGGGDAETLFATAIQAELRAADTLSLCGWIVDLRQDAGGNMWPMLAGVGPVLGDGIVGAFVDPDGEVQQWYYDNGGAGIVPSAPAAQVSGVPYEIIDPMPAVAVLTGSLTSSSGEAVVTAFRGRPLTRSFGKVTKGHSTANGGYRLSDQALLILAVSTFADRTGVLYGGKIEPDEFIEGSDPWEVVAGQNDPAIDAGVAWLTEQDTCTQSL